EEDKEWAAKFLQDHNIKGDRKIVGILPGAGASWGKDAKYRRWDSARYAKLVDKIVEKFGCQIILMGDTSEADLCRKAAEIRPRDVISAYGQTSLGQLAALLQRCDAVVLNDGGPLHLAVSVQTKTVSIFGPVDDRVYGPFGDNQKHCVASKDIICRPCYRRFRMTRCDHISCLQTLTVEDVLQKVEQIL
ncbi:MAG: glycosyltransferase family 9 protein, partial [Candidatus Omnitrophica bacterium]|nr:glycosyltransferase family 9 protein [Candidatus Omnitrophota bacterium]